MEAWQIAHCMARLPRSTYFSHPESSLDDFFAGEASAVTDGDPRGDHPSSVQQRAAPHELEFLRSLGQSLGVHRPITDRSTTELDICRYHGHIVSRGHFSDSDPANEHTARRLSRSHSDLRCVADPIEAASLSSGTTSVSVSPLPSTPTTIRASTLSAQHTLSCGGLSRLQSTRPPIIVNASHNSRYQCNWEVAENQPCGKWIEGGSREVWGHVRREHGLKGLYSSWHQCRWGGCLEKLKVSSLQRHIAKHLDIKWRCSSCDMVFARYDYVRSHVKSREECHGAEVVSHLVSEQISGTSIGEAASGISSSPPNDGFVLTHSEQHFASP